MFGLGLNLAALLGTLALGYLIFARASKESGFIRSLGLVLATLIIVFSLIFVFTLFINACTIQPVVR